MFPTLRMLVPLLLTGCAVQTTMPKRPSPEATNAVAAVRPTKLVETRYEVRGYRDAANPALRHEAHSVYRQTRVPVNVSEESTTAPRTTFSPASVTPLPPSEELAAEVAAQKKLTAELFALHTALADAEQKMKAQYTGLVQQSADTLKLREQLESERSRLKNSGASDASSTQATPTATTTTDVKW